MKEIFCGVFQGYKKKILAKNELKRKYTNIKFINNPS